MPRLIPTLVVAFATTFSLAGCSGPRAEVTPLAPEASDLGGEIRVTTGDVDGSYEEMAILTVGPFGKTRKLIDALREAAQKAGADAVVRVAFESYGNGESGTHIRLATGTAVLYR